MWYSIGLKTLWICLLAASIIAAGAIAADKAYISVDESGQTVASDTPPATGTVEEVIPLPPAPSRDVTKAQEEVQRINQMADQMAAERKQKQRERAAAEGQKERQQVSCAAARSRLEQLESQPPNRRLVVDADGTAHRVSMEEMQNLLAAARRQVTEDCRPFDTLAAPEGSKSGESPNNRDTPDRRRQPGTDTPSRSVN